MVGFSPESKKSGRHVQVGWLVQFVDQRLCVLQVGGVEAFGYSLDATLLDVFMESFLGPDLASYGLTTSPRCFRYILSRHANIGANAESEVGDAVYIGRIDAGKTKRSSRGGFH